MSKIVPGGLFLALEGIGGCGKTTAVAGGYDKQRNIEIVGLKELLETDGYDVVYTRQPGGTKIGRVLRDLLLDIEHVDDIDPTTQALLFAADRRVHLRHIKQAMADGKIVITDRYMYSNVAYQIAGGSNMETIILLDRFATEGFRPHLAFWFDLDPGRARDRIHGDTRAEADRYDAAGRNFQYRLHEVYQQQVKECPELVRVDADRAPEVVIGDIYDRIKELIGG